MAAFQLLAFPIPIVTAAVALHFLAFGPRACQQLHYRLRHCATSSATPKTPPPPPPLNYLLTRQANLNQLSNLIATAAASRVAPLKMPSALCHFAAACF